MIILIIIYGDVYEFKTQNFARMQLGSTLEEISQRNQRASKQANQNSNPGLSNQADTPNHYDFLELIDLSTLIGIQQAFYKYQFNDIGKTKEEVIRKT